MLLALDCDEAVLFAVTAMITMTSVVSMLFVGERKGGYCQGVLWIWCQ